MRPTKAAVSSIWCAVKKHLVDGEAVKWLVEQSFIPKPERPPGQRRIVATYDYHDQHGQLLFQVVRYDPKDFRQRRPDGNGGWIWKLDGVDRVLYRLPELLRAAPVRDRVHLRGREGLQRSA